MTSSDFGVNVSLVKASVELSQIDLLYADEYLHRAEKPLSQCMTRERFSRHCVDREQLPQVTAGLREAAGQEDWARVRALAARGESMRERLVREADLFALADAVYGPRSLRVDGPTLALHGVVTQPAETVSRLRATAISHLGLLARAASEAESFYRSRVTHFEELEIDTASAVAPPHEAAELRKKVIEAAESGNFEAVRRLTDALPGKTVSSGAAPRPSRPQRKRKVSLRTGVPEAPAARATDLGLVLETLPASAALEAYLGCCCADLAELPVDPAGTDKSDPFACTCGHSCPPEIADRLRDNLDLLLRRPFITSAGDRYLPWFDEETLMVESFPETDPNARTPLLAELGITDRHGASRFVVEDALLTQGPRLIRDLGLDPIDFEIVCIPFDAYLRLAPKHGWGQQDLWTHFDGYQVTRDFRLWALVGGYRQFGGAEDLCGIGRDYESIRVTARFAIVRRARLLGRQAETIPDEAA